MKNKNIFFGITMLCLIVVLFTQCKSKTTSTESASTESTLMKQSSDSLIKLGAVGNVPIPEHVRDSTVVYRIDNYLSETEGRVYLTVVLNKSGNPTSAPTDTCPEVQLKDSANMVSYSPYTTWNGSDSLITTFKIRVVSPSGTELKNEIKTERIISPMNNKFFTIKLGGKQNFRNPDAGAIPRIKVYKSSDSKIVVGWPPTSH